MADDLKNKATDNKQKPELSRLVNAAVEETAERSMSLMKEAFPLLDPKRYQRAIMSLPGVGFATSVVKKSSVFDKKEQKKEKADVEKQSLTVLESILGEVIKIRSALEKSPLKKGMKGAAPISKEEMTSLREGYAYEPPREGKGGGFKSLRTGRYVKKEEAISIEKAAAVPKKPLGMLGRAGEAVTGAGRAVTGGVARAGAAVAGAAGGALPWLAAFAAILPFFLPDDIKGVIGAIFRGLLEGIGLDKETVDAIFVPFRILSDVAEMIKKVLGLLWDGIKSIVSAIGNIINWFGDRKSKNAAEEVSRATGGTGYGEFVTGAEGAPPPVEKEISPKGAGVAAPAAPAAATAAPGGAPAPTPSVPAAAAAPAAPPPTMVTPPILDKDVEEYLNKPENATEKLRFNETNTRIVTFKNAIEVANQAIAQETDPEKKKNYQFTLKRQLEPGLKYAEKERDSIIEKAKQAAGASAAAAPAAPPPAPTPAGAATGGEAGGSATGSGAGAMSGGAGGESPAGTEGGGATTGSRGAPPPSMVPSEPTTGQDIGEQSKKIEAARATGGAGESSTSIIDKGEIAAGTEAEIRSPVPSPIAPRDELDLDVFFTAVA